MSESRWVKSKKVYISKMLEAILEAEQEEPNLSLIDWDIIVAQSAHETAWGQSVPENNLFGIKASESYRRSGRKYGKFKTHEYMKDGKKVILYDYFRAYDSWKDSILDYIRLISLVSRYKDAWAARENPSEYFKQIRLAGYATDPKYETKCIDRYNSVKELKGGIE